MKLINERSLIRDIADKWKQTYAHYMADDSYGEWAKDTARIGKVLDALDKETATAQDVAAIIGNDSWTRIPECYECEKASCKAVVEVGEQFGCYVSCGSQKTCLCANCLKIALFLISENPEQ